ncbi:A24 family peptidase [uncultured Gimesia sp.]|uniref:prepilin peptidase n=1 Tax=uncultured Gimesia sp. TaxID=1678688 RepID=UPI0030DBD94B|tara:strand:+ start:137554 stop:138651 length:1098 start_codon:yes stop_codon:yes gene_type:complete
MVYFQIKHLNSVLPTEFALLVPCAILFLLGAVVGQGVNAWVRRMSLKPVIQPLSRCQGCGARVSRWKLIPVLRWIPFQNRCAECSKPLPGSEYLLEFATGGLFAFYYFMVVSQRSLDLPSVIPPEGMFEWRLLYHYVLLTLLVAATSIDFREYLIPDQITVTGMIIGVVGATIAGQLQIIHFWVDWNQAIPGLSGPYIPDWIKVHSHWHGLTWSLSGLIAGGGLTWGLRLVSSVLLGQEALGLGDVTLMAMVGSFLGWQPILPILLLAPLCGLLIGFISRAVTGKTYLPYGPYLCAATLIVLMGWKWIWLAEWPAAVSGASPVFSIRKLYGDAMGLVMLGGIALGALILMLLLLRIYRAIPVKRR